MKGVPQQLDYATPEPSGRVIPRWLDEWFGRLVMFFLIFWLLFTVAALVTEIIG